MFGFRIISEKLYKEAKHEIAEATKALDSAIENEKLQAAKIEELTLKLYLQTLELNEVNAERDTLIYNQRDRHGCFLRNRK